MGYAGRPCQLEKIKQTTQVRDLTSIPGPVTSFTRTGAVTKSSGLWLAAYEMGMMSSSLQDAGCWRLDADLPTVRLPWHFALFISSF